MATLVQLPLGTESELELGSTFVVGRSRVCDLRIQRPCVSGLHAELTWDGDTWRVRDLGSRNGTFLDKRRLEAGEHAALVEGSTLAFGNQEPGYRLMSAAPPQLLARASNGSVVTGEGELLCLPSPEACELTIYRGAERGWLVESEDETRDLDDQETLIAGGQPWRICLPAVADQTRELEGELAPQLGDTLFEFVLSRDGEHVAVTVHGPAGPMPVKFRSHLMLLAVLARQRLADAEQPHLSAGEHGWTYRDDLLLEFDIDVRLLNLWIFRARQQFTQLGIRGVGAMIERRAGSQQLRIAVSQLRFRAT